MTSSVNAADAGGGGGRQPEPGHWQPFCPLPCGPPTPPAAPSLTCTPGQQLRAKNPDKRAAFLWAPSKPSSSPEPARPPEGVWRTARRGWCRPPPRCHSHPLIRDPLCAHSLLSWLLPPQLPASWSTHIPGGREPGQRASPRAARALQWLIGAPQPVWPQPRLTHQLGQRHGDGVLPVDAMRWALVRLGPAGPVLLPDHLPLGWLRGKSSWTSQGRARGPG